MGNAFCALPKGHCPAKDILLRLGVVASPSAVGTAVTVLFCVKRKLDGLSVELSYTFPLVLFRAGEDRCKYPPPVPCAPRLKDKRSFCGCVYF